MGALPLRDVAFPAVGEGLESITGLPEPVRNGEILLPIPFMYAAQFQSFSRRNQRVLIDIRRFGLRESGQFLVVSADLPAFVLAHQNRTIKIKKL